jgi:hypothetical protein
MNKQNIKPIKAEITVVFKTCDLMNNEEFMQKYNGDIEKAIAEILENYPLIELIDEECIILNIKKHQD